MGKVSVQIFWLLDHEGPSELSGGTVTSTIFGSAARGVCGAAAVVTARMYNGCAIVSEFALPQVSSATVLSQPAENAEQENRKKYALARRYAPDRSAVIAAFLIMQGRHGIRSSIDCKHEIPGRLWTNGSGCSRSTATRTKGLATGFDSVALRTHPPIDSVFVPAPACGAGSGTGQLNRLSADKS
jgi:hypothetical protein